MINDIKNNTERRMQKVCENLRHEMSKIRTSRANASFLDHVMVEYYDNLTPINQVANVSCADSRTLMVTPWEKSMTIAIEKAILNSDLGLNPVTVGNAIRVPMPALNEERRKDLIKVVRTEAEQAKVSARNVRRDANNELKNLVKSKDISEDDERRANDIIQKITDKFIQEIDNILSTKEKDLLEF